MRALPTALLVLVLAGCQHGPSVQASAPAAAALPLEDEGTLQVSLHGQQVGTESFQLRRAPRGWELHSESRLKAQAGEAQLSSTLRTDERFHPEGGAVRTRSGPEQV